MRRCFSSTVAPLRLGGMCREDELDVDASPSVASSVGAMTFSRARENDRPDRRADRLPAFAAYRARRRTRWYCSARFVELEVVRERARDLLGGRDVELARWRPELARPWASLPGAEPRALLREGADPLLELEDGSSPLARRASRRGFRPRAETSPPERIERVVSGHGDTRRWMCLTYGRPRLEASARPSVKREAAVERAFPTQHPFHEQHGSRHEGAEEESRRSRRSRGA